MRTVYAGRSAQRLVGSGQSDIATVPPRSGRRIAQGETLGTQAIVGLRPVGLTEFHAGFSERAKSKGAENTENNPGL